jgi:hypothetical protein
MSLPNTMPSPEDARLIALGRKVEALLASEEAAGRLREAIDRSEPGYLSSAGLFASTNAVLAWFREQLLEPEQPGSLQTGGATGGDVSQLIRAAAFADWEQVRLNGGPPCFHLDGENFCLRAERWAGHPSDHPFVTLAEMLEAASGR